MKKIILIILALLLMVGMVGSVNADRLGGELVTCGDFSCNTTWVGWLGTPEAPSSIGWDYVDTFDLASLPEDLVFATFNRYNLSQNISIESNKIYNVTINVDSSTTTGIGVGNELSIFLGGTKKLVLAM